MRATRQLLLGTSEETSLASLSESSLPVSYARIFRDDTAEPTTNVAEDHGSDSDVLQAANFNLYIRGSPRDHFFNCHWQCAT
jgi:hypothetical protein